MILLHYSSIIISRVASVDIVVIVYYFIIVYAIIIRFFIISIIYSSTINRWTARILSDILRRFSSLYRLFYASYEAVCCTTRTYLLIAYVAIVPLTPAYLWMAVAGSVGRWCGVRGWRCGGM